jgi:tetratricopeptide (TPR) repeat protein
MLSRELFQELRGSLQDRRIQAGIALLDQHKADFAAITPEQCLGGVAVGCLAQWLDVGFDCEDLLLILVERFHKTSRHTLPIADYIHLRLAEAVIAMRREDLPEALRHLDTALMVSEEIEELETIAMASLWKARCLRKAGEYDQALEITQRGRDLARSAGLHYVAAVIQTLESWLLFQKSKTKDAVRILQEAETVLRNTDDFITLGNIQSTYGRIALREGRYDHAMQYFEASIDLFQRRESLDRYLARSLTNIAQAKRFLALQLRRRIDANWERQRNAKPAERPEMQQKTAQLERMHELLRNAQADLAQADAIYKRAQNHHGAGNVDVNLAQVYLDLGDLHRAEEKAGEAFDLGASKTDYLLMCRARIVQAMVANARFEEQIGESDDPSRFAQIAHDCASDAVDLAQHTESRRLTAQAYICHGTTLVNGFFNNTESARTCCDRAEAYLDGDRHDALWEELAILRARISAPGRKEWWAISLYRKWSENSKNC